MIKEGTEVCWEWGKGEATGKVKKIFKSNVKMHISGTEVTREASVGTPAYLIEQESGAQVLKSQSEVKRA